ncbi:polysaccharide deacetylase family protein [Haloechinothrix sp. YIM 98757]|uniref:Polysaccharide deacetylase family protein n=2 Tax=Haloechinothrix aidingensis TaxID=2752311 RepID=A0A837ZY86_9PSEU|nr:polysaccharide deacetylase family protein [Haloechinothrix aidingensis]
MNRPLPLIALLVLVLAACSPAAQDVSPGKTSTQHAEPSTPRSPASTTPPEPDVNPADVGANELGEIPVLMYHRILPDGGGEYDLTPDEFRAELAYLHEHDYHPIRTVDLVRGEIDVPAGTTPVVLTFDDSTREQFGMSGDDEVDSDSAVGILLEFAEEHSDFTPTGSFYVVGSLFGGTAERGKKLLRQLHEWGFEIGNHTISHANLSRLGASEVQAELAAGAAHIHDAVPDAEVATMSLPHGASPAEPELAQYGSHDGQEYRHEGILLVGSNPAPSPFATEFDPVAIPRIRSGPDGDLESGYWFEIFEREPERRYVSDGDPSTISFPEERSEELAPEFADRANPY